MRKRKQHIQAQPLPHCARADRAAHFDLAGDPAS